MDEYLILECQTEADAQATLGAINQIAAAYWQQNGYTVVDGELIGKNAATGEDMPAACRTTTWDDVKASPANTYWITSPASDPRFPDWQDWLPPGHGLQFTERPFPAEWIVVESP